MSSVLGRVVFAGMVAGLLLASCADDPPTLDLDALVASLPETVVPENPDVVTDVDCRPPVVGVIAQAIECTAAVSGEAIIIDLAVDESGEADVSVREKLVGLEVVAAAASDRLTSDLGTTVEVVCPGTVVVARAGVTTTCTGSSGDREREMVVEILDIDGAWRIDFVR